MVAGKFDDWKEKLHEIKYMGFNYIYINPIFQTGYSRNIYAPKNFYDFNDRIVNIFSEKDSIEQFRDFIEEAHAQDMKIILEMIITHTSIDSDLLIEHPEWYSYDEFGDVRKYSIHGMNNSLIEWGDLLEINNHHEDDECREALWSYWEEMLLYYAEMGVDVIKLHSAFNVPRELLRILITKIKDKYPHIEFIGDNLGANFGDMMELAQAGVDYLFSSLKWWNFRETWFLEQHYKLKNLVKTISFPENYDTERIADRYNGNENASKIWYALSAFMNKGVMVPIGFETGSKTKLNELRSMDMDFYDGNLNLKDYLRKINGIKDNYQIFSEENDIYCLNQTNPNIFAMKKISLQKNERALIIANLNFNAPEKVVLNDIYYILESGDVKDISPECDEMIDSKYYERVLKPGEIKILYTKN
jgi:starch synthase (maltosyl-transferring)